MYFGGSSRGRKQPFPRLFSGQGSIATVLSVAFELQFKSYFQEVSLIIFLHTSPIITEVNESSAAVCVLCLLLREKQYSSAYAYVTQMLYYKQRTATNPSVFSKQVCTRSVAYERWKAI